MLQKYMCSEVDSTASICGEFEENPNGLNFLGKCNIFDTLFCATAYITDTNFRCNSEKVSLQSHYNNNNNIHCM